MNMLRFDMAICMKFALLKLQWHAAAVVWLHKEYTFGFGLTFCNASLIVSIEKFNWSNRIVHKIDKF